MLLTHDAPAEVVVPGHRPSPPELVEPANGNRSMVSRALSASRPALLLHGHHHVAYRSTVDLGAWARTTITGIASNIESAPENRGILEVLSLDFRSI